MEDGHSATDHCQCRSSFPEGAGCGGSQVQFSAIGSFVHPAGNHSSGERQFPNSRSPLGPVPLSELADISAIPGENHRVRVADRFPAAWRRDGSPRIFQRVVMSALIGPHGVAASTSTVVFSAFHDHPAVGQHDRTKIERGIAVGE